MKKFMKEGYLQLKIAEMNDKLNKIDQMFSMEKSKINLLEERVGGLKDLIKKLKKIDDFKENILKEINNKNKKIIEEEIQNISKKIENKIKLLIIEKTKEIENIYNYIKSREIQLDGQEETINSMRDDTKYLLKYNEILMMKLVNKGIFTDREVNELERRSSKEK